MAGIHIKLDDINKSYGATHVLKSIRLSINPGQFVAIVGKSGCGKSTLLRIISGLEKPTSGQITYDNVVNRGLVPQARMMFQDARLLPWKKVLGNVAIGIKKEKRATDALRNVGLLNKSNEWPEVLSGGQKQRVALARALAGEPDLILFDEPLGALDALTRIEMQRLIEKIWHARRFTSILVTHDVSEAVALADRVVLIENGSLSLDLAIDLPRPRERNDKFAAYEHSILQKILHSK